MERSQMQNTAPEQRRKTPISLQTQMILLVCLLVLSLTLIAGGLYTAMIGGALEEQIGKRALQVSKAVAQIPLVKKQILKRHPDGTLQNLAEHIRQETDAEFIVIGNRDSIRFSHPKSDRLGKKMVGGDNTLALKYGKSYISKAVGTLGPSIRGKVPIFAEDGKVIGIVSFGAITISSRFKKAIFGLEPEQIARLFTERAAIIESIREGIVAIDRNANVTVVNQVAIETLGKKSESDIIGQHIKHVLPGAKLSRILTGGKQRIDQELSVGDTTMIINTVPMLDKERIIGAVASFRRKDELDILAKQLSQVKEYSDMLRAQTHEYSNKLHTIAGLIQIGHEKEALDLIGRESAGYQGLIAFLAKAVPHPVLAAFIIGKYNHAQELRIDFEIDPDSQLVDVSPDLNREKILTILGNLLDNAFDAALQHERSPQVKLSMTDIGNDLIFEIEDSGIGITQELTDKIFEKGFSTKHADRGQGLYLVKKALQDLGGQITLADSNMGGALFSVFIPKQRNG